jgi:acyl carrier protein
MPADELTLEASSIETTVRQFILESFLIDTPAEAFHSNDDLFSILDSLQILRLVQQLDNLFGVKVADGELTADNLSTVEKVVAFVERKRQPRKNQV